MSFVVLLDYWTDNLLTHLTRGTKMSFKKIKLDDKVDDCDVSVSTETEVDNFSIDFEIKNFPDADEKIDSPIFVGGPKSQHQWKLKLDPKYKKDDDEREYFGLNLYLVKKFDDPKNTVRARFQMCLINSERKVLFAQSSESRNFTNKQGWGWQDFILKSEVLNPRKGILTDGHILKIHCDISIILGLGKPTVVNKKFKINSNSYPQSNVTSYIEKMSSFLDGGTFSDFTIKANTGSFPVSKIILAGRSDVFHSMFNSGMKESTANSMKIEDHSEDTVYGMLQFIYTGKIELAETNVKDLLSIADQYQVLDLKQKCEEFLLENLKIENAADTLIMAHFHSPTILKPHVMTFINGYKNQVKLTDGFKRVKNTLPLIFADLYESIN